MFCGIAVCHESPNISSVTASMPQVQEIRIANDEMGWSFAKLFAKPLADSPTHIRIQDPYLHARHQVSESLKCVLVSSDLSLMLDVFGSKKL